MTNLFGLFREYQNPPPHDPDESLSLNDLSASATVFPILNFIDQVPGSLQSLVEDGPVDEQSSNDPLQGCSSRSAQLLMSWMWNGSNIKSLEECNSLVHDVIMDPEFQVSDLKNFNVHSETAKLDHALGGQQNGWRASDIDIAIPDGKKHSSPNNPLIPTFPVPGLVYRSITEVIKSSWSDPSITGLHYVPYWQFWQRDDEVIECIHNELYASEAFNTAYEDLQKSDLESGCHLEKVICSLMFWSDSTHLASFGDASLWSLYMYFGNQLKYIHSRPSSGAYHHMAYISKVTLPFVNQPLATYQYF